MWLPPNDTLLLISSAAFETYEDMVMLSCEDSASLDAAAVGTDAVFMAPFVSKSTVWAQVPGLATLCVSQLLFIGLFYAKTSINVG